MGARNLDADLDSSKNGTAALDLARARRPLQEQKRVNIDFPTWMIESLDWDAMRVGVALQSIIKVRLAERLEQTASDKCIEATPWAVRLIHGAAAERKQEASRSVGVVSRPSWGPRSSSQAASS